MANENALEKNRLNIGFIPLTDCATLAVAKEKNFFEKYGLDIHLSREASWANIRDKLAYGVLDCAQMLATMPITSTLGVGGWKKDTVCSMVLGVNGNAITVSNGLYQELKDCNPEFDTHYPVTADTLKEVIRRRQEKGAKPLTFAHVFPTSTHNYLLRYWLASAGIEPDKDMKLIVIPPQQMVKNLEANIVDGFCVGEPWNQYAIDKGIGHVLITSYQIWNNAPEKVLGVNKEWAYNHPNTHKAVIKALIEAARWIDENENRLEVAEIVAKEEYINIPAEVIREPLMGHYSFHKDESPVSAPDFNLFYKYLATFPWHSQAAWFMSQMIRWKDVSENIDVKNIIKDIFWVDLYREIAEEMELDYPMENHKSEGEHSESWSLKTKHGEMKMPSDKFFDGTSFKI